MRAARMAASLPLLKDIERLSPRVIRILGGNPGKFTLQGTNTYLIGQGDSRILLDTGAGERAWQASLKAVLTSEATSISTALLTHWHPDHISGVPDLQSLNANTQIYKHRPSYRGNAEWGDIAPGQVFKTEGATLRAVHCPGHTEDHMAFVLEEEDAMFTADNVLGHGTAVFEDLRAYLTSLASMKVAFQGRAYPGHGEVIEDGQAKIEEYITHQKAREEQVLQVLGRKNGLRDESDRWSSMEVVKVIYRDVNEELHIPAEGGVVQILCKLEQDGKVKRASEDGLWQLGRNANL